MPPRPSFLGPQKLAFRPRSIVPQKRFAPIQRCWASDDSPKGAVQANPSEASGSPNEGQAAHVTEEQAALDKVMGGTPPQIEEQGTPVSEILQRDKDAQQKAPKVLQQEISKNANQGQSRSYSTSSRKQSTEHDLRMLSEYSNDMATFQESGVQFDGTMAEGLEYPDAGLGHKFPMPDMTEWKLTNHLRRRYDPVVDQVTKSIMRDGKLSQAQKNMSIILDQLRTAPTPSSPTNAAGRALLSDTQIETVNTKAPLIPRSSLPLSPIQYLTSAIDSVAPLVKIRQQKGMAGGGASTPIPVPLRVKQRRRTAIKWILSAAESRIETSLADRLAKEIIKVADGTSSAWEKRQQVHRLAVAARSNVRSSLQRRRKRR